MLAGGGVAGIAWEIGVLRGIADASPATADVLRESDVLVGTSAGSTVAAQLISGLRLDELFERQIQASTTELNPNVGVEAITELFLTAMTQPRLESRETAEDRQRRTVHGDRIGGRAAPSDRTPVARA